MLSLLLRQCSKELKPFAFMQRRTFLFRKKPSEKKYRLKDKIDESFSIIYKAPMEYYLLSCNYMTTISAITFGSFALYRYWTDFTPVKGGREYEFELSNGMAKISDRDFNIFAVSIVLLAASVRLILHKYPLRIYRNHTQ
jgi:hypothetical protein